MLTPLLKSLRAPLRRLLGRWANLRRVEPDPAPPGTLIQNVVGSREVQQTIDECAAATGQPRPRMERRARRYGREIAARMSSPVLRGMDQLLHRLWNRLYAGVQVQGLERVKALAGEHTLVYVPCHRSHIDYLLLSYVLYRGGLAPPYVAAGRNLDMPVIGPLLRRGGAFFMRRSFKGNRLYAVVFEEYLHQLLSRGHPVEYFIEGGRSRSGRMLAPRPGMLAMTLRSWLRGTPRELVFIPVYIGYEKVLESASYLEELQGKRKKKESPFDLVRVLGQLRQPFGRVAVTIGEPLKLGEFLDRSIPHWRQSPNTPRPPWLTQAVPALGRELSQRINAAAALNSVNLVALVLLATPKRAIETRRLEVQMALLVALARRQASATSINLPAGTPDTWLEEAATLGFVERHPQALGEVVLATPQQEALLSWYRNNVLHRFALPALVAFAFRYSASFERDTLHELLEPVWPLIAQELFASLPGGFSTALDEALVSLAEEGLLKRQDGRWHRSPDHEAAGERLELLVQLVQPALERSYLLLATLLHYPDGSLTREALEAHSHQLAEQWIVMSGLNAPEFFDRRLFSGLLDTLEAQGWLWQEDGRLCFDKALESAAQWRARALFDPALRQRLHRFVSQHQAGLFRLHGYHKI